MSLTVPHQTDSVVPVSDEPSAEELAALGIQPCPAGCGTFMEMLSPEWMTGVPELDRTPPAGYAGASNIDGRQLTREQMTHKATHQFRCPGCLRSFCGRCLAVPYHAGLTCEEHAAPRCELCGELPRLSATAATAARPGVSEMRHALTARGQPIDGLLERSELELAHEQLLTICGSAACAESLSRSCRRKLSCGHWCAGIAGEAECLGCLRSGCACRRGEAQLITSTSHALEETACTTSGADDAAMVVDTETIATAGASSATAQAQQPPEEQEDQEECLMCQERLRRGPAIALRCGHLCHLECAVQQLKRGYPGPQVSFQHLHCPLCRGAGGGPNGSGGGGGGGGGGARRALELELPALSEPIRAPLALRGAVTALARSQLREASSELKQQVAPGGAYDGRLLDFALAQWSYYECDSCGDAFCGGARRCGAAAEGEGEGTRRLCARCVAVGAGVCPEHGDAHLEWKCRYCCSVASWFCWGTTHMCDSCHQATEAGTLSWTAGSGCSASSCPLRLSHGPHGQELCLGCGMCRSRRP